MQLNVVILFQEVNVIVTFRYKSSSSTVLSHSDGRMPPTHRFTFSVVSVQTNVSDPRTAFSETTHSLSILRPNIDYLLPTIRQNEGFI